MSTTERDTLSSIGLPKWPAMVVRGDDVTLQQAKQIIVRTSGLYFGGNDRDFCRSLHEAAGIVVDDKGFEDWRSQEEACKRYGVLGLEYLSNRRIVSSWIGGPHGWCDWDGSIRCSNFNIGKWPTTERVLLEWQVIASAFPYLTLHCQLFSGETCEEGIIPLVQYNVRDGQVSWEVPDQALASPASLSESVLLARFASANFGEHGCTLEEFVAALALCDTTTTGEENGK